MKTVAVAQNVIYTNHLRIASNNYQLGYTLKMAINIYVSQCFGKIVNDIAQCDNVIANDLLYSKHFTMVYENNIITVSM